MGLDGGNYFRWDRLAFTRMMVEVDYDCGAVRQQVGVGSIAHFVFKGPGPGANVDGASEDIYCHGEKDGLLEVNLGPRQGHVEFMRVLQPRDM